MRTVLKDMPEMIGDRIKIITTVYRRDHDDEFPEPTKWKLQLLFMVGAGWKPICRIDNYLHEGKVGSHIHIKTHVIWEDLTFDEAFEKIKELGPRIIQKEYHK